MRVAEDNESPNVNRAAPNKTTSFRRKPPEPDKAGKPPRLRSQPGSEKRKERVAKNVKVARTLPIADNRGAIGLIAIKMAAASSVTPITFEGRSLQR